MKVVAYCYKDPLLAFTPVSNTESRDWGQDITQVYEDIGDRQQRQQLLQDCQQGSIDCLLIQRVESLGDSGAEVADCLATLAKAGVQVVSLDSAENSTTIWDLLRSIQTSKQQDRIRQGHARNRLKALPPPGAAPFGYRRGKDRYALDRAAAAIVKDFFEQFLLYGSLRRAVQHLSKKYGKTISVSTGRRWLTNPVYRGDLAYNTGARVLNTHVPILSREEAAQIDRLLRRNQSLPRRAASAMRSLSGLVVCAHCQTGMRVSRVTNRQTGRRSSHPAQEYLYLRPVHCPQQPKCKAIPYDQVLTQTIQRICEDLPKAVSTAGLPDMERIKQGIEATIAQKQAILQQLPALKTSGILDEETLQLRTQTLQTEIAQLQDKRLQLPPVNLKTIAQTVSIQQFWLDLSEAERRFYFREFIRQIEILREADHWQVKLIFIF